MRCAVGWKPTSKNPGHGIFRAASRLLLLEARAQRTTMAVTTVINATSPGSGRPAVSRLDTARNTLRPAGVPVADLLRRARASAPTTLAEKQDAFAEIVRRFQDMAFGCA